MKNNITFIFTLLLSVTSTFPFVFGGNSCHEVRKTFAVKQIGPLGMVPFNPILTNNLRVCPNGRPTCCTRRMERKYKDASSNDLQDFLEHQISLLKQPLAQLARQFNADVIDLVTNLRNVTFVALSTSFPDIDQTILKSTSESLFQDIVITDDDDISNDLINVEYSIDRFTSSLLTYAFEQQTSTSLTSVQSRCIQEFANSHYERIQAKLRSEVATSTETILLHLQALESAVEVINLSFRSLVSNGCKESLLRMQYCSHCYGLTLIKPCPGLCINVMRGCLVGLSEINEIWKYFVSGLEMMKRKLEEDNDVEVVSKRIAKLVVESTEIKLTQENINQIKSSCQMTSNRSRRSTKEPNSRGRKRRNRHHRGRSDRNVDLRPPVRPPHEVLKVALPIIVEEQRREEGRRFYKEDESGKNKMLLNAGRRQQDSKSSFIRFIDVINLSMDIFNVLPEKFCNSDDTKLLRDCWDGSTIVKKYSKPIVNEGLKDQSSNPEVRVKGLKQNTRKVVERLRVVAKTLMLETGHTNIPNILTSLPLLTRERTSNFSLIENPEIPCGDDEDHCGEGSGKGSGEENEEEKLAEISHNKYEKEKLPKERMHEGDERLPRIVPTSATLESEKLSVTESITEKKDGATAADNDGGTGSVPGLHVNGISLRTLFCQLLLAYIIQLIVV